MIKIVNHYPKLVSLGIPMTEIELKTIDGKTVSFAGELACQTQKNIEFSDGIERKFELKLYALESGGFVPSIEYTSSSHVERSGCVAEVVDLAKDIENFLFVFIPEELLPESAGLSRDELELRTRLLSCLRKTYESLTFDFLDQVEIAMQQLATTHQPADSKPSNSSGV